MKRSLLLLLLVTVASASLAYALDSPSRAIAEVEAQPMATSQPGDVAMYAVAASEPVTWPLLVEVRIEQRENTTIQTSDGTLSEARVHMETRTWLRENNHTYQTWVETYELESGRSWSRALEERVVTSGWQSRGISVNAGLFSQSPPVSIEEASWFGGGDAGTCGLRGPMQSSARLPSASCPSTWDLTGLASLDNRTITIYQSRHGDAQVEAWFYPDEPYPLQLTAAANGQTISLQRVQFDSVPAQQALTQHHSALRFPGMARSDAGVPDASGLAIAFPLHEALDVASRSEAGQRFSTLLARGTGYLQSAHLEGAVEDLFTRWVWTLQASDGIQAEAVRVQLAVANDGNPMPFDPLTMGPLFADPDQVLRIDAGPVGPRIGHVPADLPNLKALAQTWSAASGDVPRTYAFSHVCLDALCQRGDAWVGVGNMTVPSDYNRYGFIGAPGAVEETLSQVTKNSMLVVNLTGFQGWTYLEHVRTVNEPGAVAIVSGDAPWLPDPQPRAPFASPATPYYVVALTAGLAGLVALLSMLRSGSLVLLFARITGTDLTKHPKRAAILAAIEADPGISHAQLQRDLGLATGTLQHHVKKLLEARLIDLRRDSQLRYHLPQHAAQLPTGLGLTAAAQRMLHAICEKPGQSISELAESTGVAQSTASHHIKQLQAAKKVRLERFGRRARVWLSDP